MYNEKGFSEEDFWKKMTGFNYIFGLAENDNAIYRNEKIYFYYHYNLKGKHTLKFSMVYSNPNEERGICLNTIHFKGSIDNYEDEKLFKRSGAYSGYDILGTDWKEKKIIVDLKEGFLGITNGKFQTSGDVLFLNSGGLWQAMKVEQISPTKFRFYCNDTVLEDDFDDLIFEMEIID